MEELGYASMQESGRRMGSRLYDLPLVFFFGLYEGRD